MKYVVNNKDLYNCIPTFATPRIYIYIWDIQLDIVMDYF
jgi:hypothetical protein